jgi:hypothetical protein
LRTVSGPQPISWPIDVVLRTCVTYRSNTLLVFKFGELARALRRPESHPGGEQASPDHRWADCMVAAQLLQRCALAVTRGQVVDVDLTLAWPHLDAISFQHVTQMALRSTKSVGQVS